MCDPWPKAILKPLIGIAKLPGLAKSGEKSEVSFKYTVARAIFPRKLVSLRTQNHISVHFRPNDSIELYIHR